MNEDLQKAFDTFLEKEGFIDAFAYPFENYLAQKSFQAGAEYQAKKMQEENTKLRAALIDMVEALGFYGRPDSYSLSTHIRPRVKSMQRILTAMDASQIDTHILLVGGKRARQALEKHAELIKGLR